MIYSSWPLKGVSQDPCIGGALPLAHAQLQAINPRKAGIRESGPLRADRKDRVVPAADT